MSKNLKRLASQVAVYGISSVVARLLNYLLVPYYTRIMSPAEYGVITDIYALIPFALVVLSMGMESGYFRFAAKAEGAEGVRKVYASTWGIVLLVSALFFALVALFNTPLSRAMGYEGRDYLLVAAGIITLDVAAMIPFSRLRQEGKALTYALLKLLSVIINIGLCILFYNAQLECFAFYDTPTDAGYALVANLVASAVTLVLLLCCNKWQSPRISRKVLRPIVLFSLPLLVSGIAGTTNEFIDRQMIKYLMPAENSLAALGIYGAVLKIGVVMQLFTQMYRLAAEPFFLAEFKKDEFKNTNAETMKYFIIVSVAIFLLITLFSDLFALIVGPDFREGMHILPIVLVSNALSGVVLNLSFWYKQSGATKYAIVVTFTGLLFTVVFNIMLVPTLGYVGAALARLVCEFAMVVVSYRLGQRHYPIPYDLKRIGEYIVVGAAIYALSWSTSDLAPAIKYIESTLLLIGFAAYAVRRERINLGGIIKSILHRK